jgi:archaellum component FlaC
VVAATIYQWLLITLLGVIGYFLRGIMSSFKRLETDFGKFREEYAGHRAEFGETQRRLDRIESRMDEYSQDIRDIMINVGKK